MDEQKVRRPRRTPQQIAEQVDIQIQKLNQDLEGLEEKRAAANAGFDAKAASIKEKIATLEQKKTDLLQPKPSRKTRKSKKQKIQEIIKLANKSGLKPEEIMERLGLEQTEE